MILQKSYSYADLLLKKQFSLLSILKIIFVDVKKINCHFKIWGMSVLKKKKKKDTFIQQGCIELTLKNIYVTKNQKKTCSFKLSEDWSSGAENSALITNKLHFTRYFLNRKQLF